MKRTTASSVTDRRVKAYIRAFAVDNARSSANEDNPLLKLCNAIPVELLHEHFANTCLGMVSRDFHAIFEAKVDPMNFVSGSSKWKKFLRLFGVYHKMSETDENKTILNNLSNQVWFVPKGSNTDESFKARISTVMDQITLKVLSHSLRKGRVDLLNALYVISSVEKLIQSKLHWLFVITAAADNVDALRIMHARRNRAIHEYTSNIVKAASTNRSIKSLAFMHEMGYAKTIMFSLMHPHDLLAVENMIGQQINAFFDVQKSIANGNIDFVRWMVKQRRTSWRYVMKSVIAWVNMANDPKTIEKRFGVIDQILAEGCPFNVEDLVVVNMKVQVLECLIGNPMCPRPDYRFLGDIVVTNNLDVIEFAYKKNLYGIAEIMLMSIKYANITVLQHVEKYTGILSDYGKDAIKNLVLNAAADHYNEKVIEWIESIGVVLDYPKLIAHLIITSKCHSAKKLLAKGHDIDVEYMKSIIADPGTVIDSVGLETIASANWELVAPCVSRILRRKYPMWTDERAIANMRQYVNAISNMSAAEYRQHAKTIGIDSKKMSRKQLLCKLGKLIGE